MKYYKVLSEDMKHYNMQYHEGLNVNCEATYYNGNCKHGLFFSDVEHILEFCNYGTKIAEVEIPDGERIDICGIKYKAHRIILKNIRDLWTVETFQELVSNGINIHADDDFALKLAAENGHFEVAKYLIEHRANAHASNDWALQVAAEMGHFEIVKYMVEQGADIDANNEYAFRYAAANGHLEVVKYLIELGADIHTCNDWALKFAERNNNLNVVGYLKSLV